MLTLAVVLSALNILCGDVSKDFTINPVRELELRSPAFRSIYDPYA
jgi:hypothetical protein